MEKKKKVSLLFQVAMLFIIGVILIGTLSTFALYVFSTKYVMERLETSGQSTAEDLKGYIYDYPAHDWLLRYWYEHYDEMNIEYDAVYSDGTWTEEKYALITELHPDFRVEYANTEEIEALPPDDQKLYAEIIYSWLIDRIDYMQLAYDLDYFFCVVTDEPYDQQFVLFIAADEGEERGPRPGQIYPIGKIIKVTEETQKAVRGAISGDPQVAHNQDQKFFDYYYSMTSIDGHEVLAVLTIDVRRVREAALKYLYDFGLLFAVMIVVLAVGCLLISVVI